MGIAGNNRFAKGVLNASATGIADLIVFDRDDAMKRIFDGVIPGATAEVSLRRRGDLLFLFRKACGGHDHSAVQTTLIRLSVEKRLCIGWSDPLVASPAR